MYTEFNPPPFKSNINPPKQFSCHEAFELGCILWNKCSFEN